MEAPNRHTFTVNLSLDKEATAKELTIVPHAGKFLVQLDGNTVSVLAHFCMSCDQWNQISGNLSTNVIDQIGISINKNYAAF